MPANVETMFYVGRNVPWHGLGASVIEAPDSQEALEVAGLNWTVIQQPIYTAGRQVIPNYKANVRDTDNSVLGVVTDRYQIVQNDEAFAFTDELLGQGVRYETAGSLQSGKRVWMLAKLPEKYIIAGEKIEPFLVFSNSHDGTAGIKVAVTPVRVVCQNTLNLALNTARRSWSAKHTGNVQERMHEARETLGLAHMYMEKLGAEFNKLSQIKLSDTSIFGFINDLLPYPADATQVQRKNVDQLRGDIQTRYFDAPDLKPLPKTGYRLINAVSDFATHAKPLRETASYKENLFLKTMEGNPTIDKAYSMLTAA